MCFSLEISKGRLFDYWVWQSRDGNSPELSADSSSQLNSELENLGAECHSEFEVKVMTHWLEKDVIWWCSSTEGLVVDALSVSQSAPKLRTADVKHFFLSVIMCIYLNHSWLLLLWPSPNIDKVRQRTEVVHLRIFQVWRYIAVFLIYKSRRTDWFIGSDLGNSLRFQRWPVKLLTLDT